MSINTFEKEEMKEMSMIEIAFELLKDAKQPLAFKEMFAKVAEAKELTDEQQAERIANLYTDLNVDGRFINVGENQWGLKKWYPIERIEEELTAKSSKKRATKGKDDDDFDYDLDEEELDEEELEDEDLEEDVDELVEDEEFLEDDEEDEKLDGFVEEDEYEEEEIDEDF